MWISCLPGSANECETNYGGDYELLVTKERRPNFKNERAALEDVSQMDASANRASVTCGLFGSNDLRYDLGKSY